MTSALVRRDRDGITWLYNNARWALTREHELPLRCIGIGYHRITNMDGLKLMYVGLAKYHADGWVLTELGADVLGELKNAEHRAGDGRGSVDPGDQARE